jgi:hypothetical protein
MDTDRSGPRDDGTADKAKSGETRLTTDPAQGRDGWRAGKARQQLQFFTRSRRERGEGAVLQ